MESGLIKKLIALIKALKCKSKCCSGSSCQLGDYQEPDDPNVETRDFEDF
jgi:hypothetical protein